MSETLAMIEKALALAGIELVFATFSIQGIVGFNISQLYKGEQTVYGIETQNFSFQVSTEDVVANSIVEDMQFTVEDFVNTYTFQVSRTPVNDITGWSEIHCIYVSGVVS